eukprot:CAMPEP_0206325634 /NCGR_PEP_ID=MMETSP0106_2-20121207/21179_1 /ASSEMBLY_ACC=CAM_ASM_000206 /TAXON_ID=81532 /ORGANISM="Acanthoeca-like sp., Strain 10tr" /LENGTH=59 /DNA_ID=CAMNT_0053758117 /DNA_START=10 /DNA_END=189 /DNA_ORIENTATION=-
MRESAAKGSASSPGGSDWKTRSLGGSRASGCFGGTTGSMRAITALSEGSAMQKKSSREA